MINTVTILLYCSIFRGGVYDGIETVTVCYPKYNQGC